MKLDVTVAALGDPTRRRLLGRLADKPCRAGDLAQGFAITRPAICKHTRILMAAGLIRVTRRGRERIYELAPSGGQLVKETIAKFEEVGQFWDTALTAFKRYAEERS
ncbi:MAG: ArsR/SmtB family transcription factor [Candidatus Binataceae bacterium]